MFRGGPLSPLLAVVLLVLGLLGIRTLVSPDLGYNLEYGRAFLSSGKIVDHVDFLYTLPATDLPERERPEPGPGAGYDDHGRYRFVNANWLSQVVMAVVHGAAGLPGLVVLGLVLGLAVHALMYAAMRRLGVAAPVAVAGLGLYIIAASGRFNLRPELFAFAFLAGQLVILAPAASDPRRAADLTWRSVSALLLLQVLFVNAHSYFMLGIGVAVSIVVQSSLAWWLARDGRVPEQRDTARRATGRSGLVLSGLVAVSVFNPWGVRLAILPLQTLAYMKRHGIAGGHGEHPWSHIVELHSPFRPPFPVLLSDYGVLALFALSALGLLAAALRRKWAYVVMIAGMGLTALSMTRNVASGGIVLVPVVLASLADGDVLRRLGIASRQRISGLASAALILAFGVLGGLVVTNRLYYLDGSAARFGVGISTSALPVGAARWLAVHAPDGRIWCDTDSSSTLRFFSDPPRELPILTNQWAYPPSVMAENQRLRAGQIPFDTAVAQYGVQIVALRATTSAPLFQSLATDERWTAVFVDGDSVVFVRNDAALAEVAARNALAEFRGNVADYVEQRRAIDTLVGRSLIPTGRILQRVGAFDLAIAVFEAALAEVDDDARVWSALGSCYASRAGRRHATDALGSLEDFREAREHFRRAVALEPDYEFAQRALARVETIVGPG